MSISRARMGLLSWMIRETRRMLSVISMGSPSMGAGFASSLLKEMTVEVTVIATEEEDLTEIPIEEGKYLMGSSSEQTTGWWLKTCPREHLGRT